MHNSSTYEFPYVKPERLRWSENVRKEIWNAETHEFLGRTAKSWGGILTFYVIFFSALAALFAICMKGMPLSMDDRRPKYLMDNGVIGSNPGLGFRPISENVKAGALIWYQAANESNYRHWTDQLDKFLEPYRIAQKLPGGGKNQQVCDFETSPAEGKVCAVDVKRFEPCTSEMGYGYNRSAPCIFIKLNKIYDWVPDYYDKSNLPKEMPADLKNHILATDPKELNQVWVSCRGESPADRENLGPIKYIPSQGFPGYYYPYRNVNGYLSPLIALHLARPHLNSLINIECRAWAKNIIYSNMLGHREGSVHFEVMID
ncbi:sodium/potassium-transporting ATPase subunit beta-2-like [Periplaneta americana]|uniref:sodium/potassium-transporting ATPase subunit beta-2-like n=1 Tax=Periplaneta americana TaxID=6978 RepID=UPI0037E7C89F